MTIKVYTESKIENRRIPKLIAYFEVRKEGGILSISYFLAKFTEGKY